VVFPWGRGKPGGGDGGEHAKAKNENGPGKERVFKGTERSVGGTRCLIGKYWKEREGGEVRMAVERRGVRRDSP